MEERDAQDFTKYQKKKSGVKTVQHHMKNPFNKEASKQSILITMRFS